ncbi:MAG: ribonuclease HI [Holophagae bacterium]|nr:MAG: ribonuclease HI [Holophagae bacterium]
MAAASGAEGSPVTRSLPTATLYTDGGCRPNPGPGGWAAVVLRPGEDPLELSAAVPATTNNRMELQAAIEGLRALPSAHRVELFTDSEYVRKGITEWLERWLRNGWRTAGKKEVQNGELWRELAAELERHHVTWHWVKGHAGDRWNERADELASAAIPRPPLPVDDPGAVHLFLGVAHSGTRNTGAWAVVLRFGDRERTIAGLEAGASANRMHLVSAVSGLRALRREVRAHVYTASDYLKDGATAWLGGWRDRGFVTRDGDPVAHADLWRELDRLQRRHDVRWHVASRDELPEEMLEAKRQAREALGA